MMAENRPFIMEKKCIDRTSKRLEAEQPQEN